MGDLFDARLKLLEIELNNIESSIRSFDSIAFQVKGWCVTATLAIAGFAADGHRALLPLAFVAVVAFWIVDAQNRLIQRAFIARNRALRENLVNFGLADVLSGLGNIPTVGIPKLFGNLGANTLSLKTAVRYCLSLSREAIYPHTIGLYTLLILAITIEAFAI